ncbi:MAG: hypothetical protein PW734_06985 [Verrucomicrobium sp.]|nr:hypothetical protein [Verrucomicrobium sp.]
MAEKRYKGVIEIGGKLDGSIKASFDVLGALTKKFSANLKELQNQAKLTSGFLNTSFANLAGKQLDILNAKIERTSRSIKGLYAIQRGFAGIGSGLSRFGIGNGYVAAAATAGLGLGFKGMLHAEAEQEQAQIALSVMDRSKEKGKQDLAWIDKFAYTTPFEIPEVRSAFVRLKSRGLDPTKDDLLKTIGDAASGSGRSMDEAVQAFDDAMVNQNRMIAGFGIKVIEEGVGQGKAMVEFTNHLGNQMKVLIDKNDMEMKKRLYLAIWKDRYGGLMAEQMSTWYGMISNLKDYAVRFGLAIMQSGPFEKLKARLKEILDGIEASINNGGFKKAAEEWGQRISDLIDAILSLGKAVNWVFDHIGGLKAVFWGLGIIIGSSLIVKISGLVKGLWEIGAGLISVFSGSRVLLSALGLLDWPIVLITGAIIALVAAIDLLISRWDSISKFFSLFGGGGIGLPGLSFAGVGSSGTPNLLGSSMDYVPPSASTSGFVMAPPPSSTHKAMTDNRQYRITINAQPGQDPKSIADLVVQRMQGDEAANAAGALHD